MKTFYKKTLAACFIIGISATCSFATVMSGVDDQFGEAKHTNPKWQRLSDFSNSDPYGVTWSTDGGTTYGRSDLTAGQTVEFRVDMYQPNPGSHYANFIKLWLEDDATDFSFDPDDSILFKKVVLRNTYTNNGDVDKDNFVAESYEFPSATFYAEYTIADDFFGDIALRARVTCSESLRGNWSQQWNTTDEQYNDYFTATGDLYQGEVEDWTISVNPVPEPTTMLLFGTGLLGLAGVSRRKKK